MPVVEVVLPGVRPDPETDRVLLDPEVDDLFPAFTPAAIAAARLELPEPIFVTAVSHGFGATTAGLGFIALNLLSEPAALLTVGFL